jgi:hypothetical protein
MVEQTSKQQAPRPQARLEARRGRLPLWGRLLVVVLSIALLPIVTAACTRGPGIDAPVPNRVRGRLWVFDGDAEQADVTFDCPLRNSIGVTNELSLDWYDCNPTEDVVLVTTTVRVEDCADLAAVPGLDRVEFMLGGIATRSTFTFDSGEVVLDRDYDGEVTVFPDRDRNNFRFVIDDVWGEDASDRSVVLRDVVGTGNADIR